MKTIFKHTLLALALMVGAFTAQAQVKIGDSPTTINPGSVLELESTNKGLLMPRISLTNTTTWGLAGTAAAGMHVYNTNTAITSTNINYPTLVAKIGEYYWDGTGWVALATQVQTEMVVYYGTPRPGIISWYYSNTNGGAGENQISTPEDDPYSGYNVSNGEYTIPFDGWYIISHNWRVGYYGNAGPGSFETAVGVKFAAGGPDKDFGRTSITQNTGSIYLQNNTTTVKLKKGDIVYIGARGCDGCPNGQYQMEDVYQTIIALRN